MKSKIKHRLVVGSGDDTPDIEYASGFRAVDAAVLLVSGRKKSLIVPNLEYGRAHKETKGVEIFTPRMLGLKTPQRRGLSSWVVALLKAKDIKSVTVSPTLYFAVAEKIRRSKIRLVISKGSLFPERQVKSAEEIRKISEAQQAAVIAMRQAIAMLGKSTIDHAGCLRLKGKRLTSEMVIDAVSRSLMEHRCIGTSTIIAGGKQGADPHETGHGNLKAGEPIVMDIFPKNIDTGYWGDLTRTVIRGKATSLQKKTYNMVKAAQMASFAVLKPGITGNRVHMEGCKEMERRGFQIFFADNPSKGFTHSTGHGVGMCIHEAPGLGPGAGRLRKGNVVTVEPGYYDPDSGGVRIEDTVVLTSNGWKYLVPCEKRFEI
jgi:Xaa-Pro aminopeptidase